VKTWRVEFTRCVHDYYDMPAESEEQAITLALNFGKLVAQDDRCPSTFYDAAEL
jgi:hypothetical protein